ncbi:MAG: hypothetical protein IJ526_07250 [Lachnospiraceae bacterium]|nr:hypothetical protein [Lachnospiraceae bacterium]
MKIRKTFKIKADINQLEVGDIISFKMKDGEKVEARAVKREEGKMLMHFVDCLEDEYPMNEKSTNEGGYEGSNLRKILNTDIIDRFPDKITQKIVADKNGDLLFLLSIEEVCGLNSKFEKAEGQLSVYKRPKNRIKTLGKGGYSIWYWLRSPSDYSSYRGQCFCYVNTDGSAGSGNASGANGVAPAFYLAIDNRRACPDGDNMTNKEE